MTSPNDKELQGADFVRKLCRETLEALAYLDFKGIVNTNLVRASLFKVNCPFLIGFEIGFESK